MNDPITATSLITQADTRFDDPANQLQLHQTLYSFASGAQWMGLAMGLEPKAIAQRPYNRWGTFKYTLCSLPLIACLIGILALSAWIAILLPLAILLFYLIEAQFVFLFPLLITGSPRPLAHSRQLTRQAGGTLKVVSIVMPLACFMALGSLTPISRAQPRRAFALGCLSIIIWYEQVTANNQSAKLVAPK